jgi:hypothetical protein
MALVHPRLFQSLTRHFTSKCTIQRHDGTKNLSGGLDNADEHWVNVEGMVDIPCRVAPLILARPTASERRLTNVNGATSEFQVVLLGEYAIGSTGRRAKIDGLIHNITGLEGAPGVYTRIRTERTVPARD